MIVQCTRCTMERHDVFDLRGQINVRTYKQPDGYGICKGVEPVDRPARSDFRVEWLRRARQRAA